MWRILGVEAILMVLVSVQSDPLTRRYALPEFPVSANVSWSVSRPASFEL